jgi:hypothetical protein
MITYSFVIVEKASKPPMHDVDVYLSIDGEDSSAVETSLAEVIDKTIKQLLKSDASHFLLRKDCHVKAASNLN